MSVRTSAGRAMPDRKKDTPDADSEVGEEKAKNAKTVENRSSKHLFLASQQINCQSSTILRICNEMFAKIPRTGLIQLFLLYGKTQPSIIPDLLVQKISSCAPYSVFE